MIIAESMRRFQLILCVAVVNALVFQGMQPPFTDLNFVGEYHYQDFISFLKSENRCRFNPMNISSHLANDQSTSNDVCMGFMKTVKNMSAESQIGIFEVKYFAFDVQYNYELKPSSCEFRGNLQHVEMMLICRGKTVNGTRCDKNSACKRKGEVCQGNSMMDDQFCTPTRHLYQSCDGFSQCDRNSECRLLGSIKTCQCMDGYVDINWHCVKSELSLGEKCSYNDQCSVTNKASRCLYNETKNSRMCSCVKGYIASGSRCITDGLALNSPCSENQQCTGTENANQCIKYGSQLPTCRCNTGYIEKNASCYKTNRRLYESCELSGQCNGSHGANECKVIAGVKMCYCPVDRDIFEGECLKVGLKLDEQCMLHEQCTGTQNSGVCNADQTDKWELICQCKTGYIRHKDSCVQAKKRLYETCEINDQCNWASGKEVCTDIREGKLCMCKKGYIADKESLKCRKANQEKNNRCQINEQCNGTENANTCRLVGDTGRCSCNDGFDWIDGYCLKIGRKLFQKCSNNHQCNGTDNARNCTNTPVDNDKVCFCENGYLDFKGSCIEAGRKLNEKCETHQQCTGTENANSCRLIGNSSICTCNDRFNLINGYCLKIGQKLFESCVNHKQCNGTKKAQNCTKHRVENNKVCFCHDGYLEFKGRCIQANREINESCEINEQCTGTENANTCRFLEGEGLCSCNIKHTLVYNKCVTVEKKLFEICVINEQCNGTENTGNCTIIGNNTVCFCQDRYLDFQGRCIKGTYERNIGDECEISLQCTGTQHAGVCGKNHTCTCEEGFVRSKDGCLPEKDPLLLLIAVGGLFGVVTCSLTTLFALKRRNSQIKRLECRSSSNVQVRNIRYSIVDNIACESTAETTAVNRQSWSNALAENIYDEAYQREEQGTENVYNCSEPQCYGTQDDNDIYNHLHQKPIQMSDAIYGVPKSMSESMCSKMQEHRL